MNEFENSRNEHDSHSHSESPSGIPSAWLELGSSSKRHSHDTLNNGSGPEATDPSISLGQPGIPGYDIFEEIGRGASGVVYRAFQHKPARTVALKMLLRQQLGPDALARFRQESDSLALLQHPRFVQVYEVSFANGQPYYSMEYCAGGNLAQKINGTPLPSLEAAGIAAQLADAIQNAHEVGIVHRDLKPGNILLSGRFRENMPPPTPPVTTATTSSPQAGVQYLKITDFGLAKHVDTDSTQTRSGAILGTPSYMAPEQADETSSVTPAADIWSLGAVLYEMLTGRPPFKGVTILDTLDQVRSRAPVPPSSLNPRTPRDLETICLKCLEKEPHKRYASAAALADDLKRWLQGRPITARPISSFERTVRLCRRHPALTALAAFAVLAVGVLLAGGFIYSRRLGVAEGDKRVAQGERRAAQEIARVAREKEAVHRYRSKVDAAREIIARRRLGWCDEAMPLLDAAARIHTTARDPVELRSAITACLAGVDLCDPRTICPGLIPGAIAFRPGKRQLVAVGQFRAVLLSPMAVQVVDAGDGKTVWNFRLYAKPVWKNGQPLPDGIQSLAFSPDGRWLTAGTRAGNIYRWDLRLEKPEAIPFSGSHGRSVNRIAFAAGGKAAYTAGSDGKLLRWDIEAGWKQDGIFSSERTVEDVGVLTDGRVIASSAGKLFFLDPASLKPVHEAFSAPGAGMFSLCPHGNCVALEMSRQVGLISLVGPPNLVRTLRDPFAEALSEGQLGGVQFSPNGSLLVTTAHSEDDRRLKVWDTTNGRLLGALFVPGSGPIAANFSSDGKLLAVIAGRRTLLYRVDRSDVVSEIGLSNGQVRAFDWSPTGNELASVVTDDAGKGRFKIFQSSDGSLRDQVPIENRPGQAVPNVTWSERSGIAWTSRSSWLNLSPFNNPRQSMRMKEGIEPRVLAFDPSGQLWGALGSQLHRWTIPPDGKELPPGELIWDNRLGDIFRGVSEISDIAAGRQRIAIATRDGAFYVHHSGHQGATKQWVTNFDPLQAVAMSRDETLALACSRGGKLHIHDLASGTKLMEIDAAADSIDALDIASDGKLFATGARDGVLKLWRWDDGRLELLLTVSWPTSIRKLRFSPDGKRLGVLHSGETALRIWDIDRLKSQLSQHDLGW